MKVTMLGVHVDLQYHCNKFAAHRLATTVLNHLFNFAKASLISFEKRSVYRVSNDPIIIIKEFTCT